MQRARCSGKTNPGTLRAQARGSWLLYKRKSGRQLWKPLPISEGMVENNRLYPQNSIKRVFKEISETKDALAVVAIILDFILDNV